MLLDRNPGRGTRGWIVVALWLTACASGSAMALFDQHAYENATSLKAEALALMDRAVDPFQMHGDEVHYFMTRVEAAYEYSKGIPKNGPSAAQWEILRARDGALLWGFFDLWKRRGTLIAGDIEAGKKNVADAFDSIIRLEAEKIRRE
ncbi:MAG: hypothetical protein ACE5HT_05540 [Gemmatimonadales bacterium]